MELNHYELKILRYISKYLKRKHCETISTETISQVFGDFCTPVLDKLYNSGMIACNLISDGTQIAAAEFDNWSITQKGKCCLENHRLVITLTRKEKIINWLLGFATGFFTAFFTKLF